MKDIDVSYKLLERQTQATPSFITKVKMADYTIITVLTLWTSFLK